MYVTRRDFGFLVGAGLVGARLQRDTAAAAMGQGGATSSTIAGVRLGVQTYSFRDLPRTPGAADAVDVVIKAMKDSGVSECELFAPQLEPQCFRPGAAPAARRRRRKR